MSFQNIRLNALYTYDLIKSLIKSITARQYRTSSFSIVLLISNGSVCVCMYVMGGLLCTNCQFELFTFQAITFVDVLGNV